MQRRVILAALRDGPRTTTELVELFPDLSRFAVMNHINLLRETGLISVREDGPRKINSLNAIPLRRIYEELVNDYQDHWARQLMRIKEHAESSIQEDDEQA